MDAVHLLLLDKNHPPSSLRNEVDVGGNVGPFLVSGVVNRPIFSIFFLLGDQYPQVEVLQSTCKNLGCRLFPRALAIDFVEAEASELEKQLLQEEEKHFGPWGISMESLGDCGVRCPVVIEVIS